MTELTSTANTALQALEEAAGDPRLSPGAVENIRRWLVEPQYAEYVDQIAQHLAEGKIQELDDAFWTVIPFGTGGRRGRMYPIGSNAINDRTIGESAQGLATYVRSKVQGELSCAIAYDTRHRSREFAELCAGIMVANGFRVDFLDGHRSTPELSYLVRHRKCSCGIMVTASHNPPSDNAVKVYWSTGGQILPPHDKAIIEQVMQVREIQRADFAESLAAGRVVDVTAETDQAYLDAVLQQRSEGPRDLRIIYSPLHGVGELSVAGALQRDGFQQVEIYGPHQQPSGDFPNVPGHVSNPENPEVFAAIIERAQQAGADLILATDPDCDRMGCAAPLGGDPQGPWATFNGNQIGALLCDFVLQQQQDAGTLTPEHYIVTTLVTTQMLWRIADSYGVRTFGGELVGFKWIGGRMDQEGPDKFLYGAEESHGYLVGQYARDKDGAVACMLMAELAAQAKGSGQSLHEKLEALHWQHGYHAERLLNLRMEGSEGMANMQALMQRLRSAPPRSLAGLDVAAVRDHQKLQVTRLPDKRTEPLEGPRADMVILDLAEEGNYVAVRPSGTEPKVKFYMFVYVPAEQLHDLHATQQAMQKRLESIESDMRSYAGS